MKYQEELEKLLKEKDGLIFTRDIVKAGISKQVLGNYVKKGYIERISHGIYLSKDAFEDEMYVLQARSKKVVFSHETALFLHDLSDRDPLDYTVTLPSGYNATRFKENGVNVYFIKDELLEIGVEYGKTIFGRNIRVYDKERTICDLIRSRNSMDVAIVNEGIKRYLIRKDKNIAKLMKYAKIFKVDKNLRNYLEVIL
jgi:predicted transcriptional regulator of viral defense system